MNIQTESILKQGAGGSLRPDFAMTQCPKFQGCNATICPLDADWHKRSNLSEDATCFYLTESVKHGAEAVFKGAGLTQLFEVMQRLTPAIADKHSRIRRALERAKLTSSRMANGQRLGKGANHV
jgi:hypothetical protein